MQALHRSVVALALAMSPTILFAQGPTFAWVAPSANQHFSTPDNITIQWRGCTNSASSTSHTTLNNVVVTTTRTPTTTGCAGFSKKWLYTASVTLNAGPNQLTGEIEDPNGGAGGSRTVYYDAPISVASVEVTAVPEQVAKGQVFSVTARAFDASHNELTGRQITWSANGFTVPASGTSPSTVNATAGQVAMMGSITATSETIQGSDQVQIIEPVVTVSVSVSPTTIQIGQVATATVRTYAADGSELTGRAVSWSGSGVSPSPVQGTTVATTVVTATAVGAGSISAVSEGVTGSAPITVIPKPVASVVVSATAFLEIGQTATATARTFAADGQELTGRVVTWNGSKVSASPTSGSSAATTTVTGQTAGAGSITATSEGVSGAANVTVADGSGHYVATIALAYADRMRDVGRCVASCFAATAAYSTATYRSIDVERGVTLLYRSDRARPIATIQLDATDNSTTPADTLSLRLQRSDGSFVNLVNGSTELYFQGGSGVTRLAAQFEATAMSTQAALYTAIVTSRWADGIQRLATVPARVLIINDAASEFGAGWQMAQLQRLHLQPDGAMIVSGDGSASFFTPEVINSQSGTWTASGMTLNGGPFKIHDADLVGHAWHSDNAVAGAHLQLNYSGPRTFNRLRIYAHNAGYAGWYTVRGSNDGSTWTAVASFQPGAVGWNQVTFAATSYQFWRAESH